MAPIRNALTFDVEEYFHAEVFTGVVPRAQWSAMESRVAQATERLLALLAETGTRATFFVLGWVAERHPDLVRAIVAQGHEVACHGYDHQMITRQSRAEFTEDIRRAKATVEDAAGVAVTGYRAPTFSVVRETLWSLEVLAESGFSTTRDLPTSTIARIPAAARVPHRGDRARREIPSFRSRPHLSDAIPGGGRWVLPPVPVRGNALGPAASTRARASGQGLLHPWRYRPRQPRLAWGAWPSPPLGNPAPPSAKLAAAAGLRVAPVRDVLATTGVMASGRVA